jgi:hypothetical protein
VFAGFIIPKPPVNRGFWKIIAEVILFQNSRNNIAQNIG